MAVIAQQSNGFSVTHSPDVDQYNSTLPGGSYVISAGSVCYTTMTVVGKGAYFQKTGFHNFQVWFSTCSERVSSRYIYNDRHNRQFQCKFIPIVWYIRFRQHAIYSNIRERVYSDKVTLMAVLPYLRFRCLKLNRLPQLPGLTVSARSDISIRSKQLWQNNNNNRYRF